MREFFVQKSWREPPTSPCFLGVWVHNFIHLKQLCGFGFVLFVWSILQIYLISRSSKDVWELISNLLVEARTQPLFRVILRGVSPCPIVLLLFVWSLLYRCIFWTAGDLKSWFKSFPKRSLPHLFLWGWFELIGPIAQVLHLFQWNFVCWFIRFMTRDIAGWFIKISFRPVNPHPQGQV